MLITGSLIPWLHYCFACQPLLRVTYTAITTSLGIVCVTITLSDEFNKPTYRWMRAVVFVCLGLSGIVPIKIHIITSGLQLSAVAPTYSWFLLMMLLYMLGTIVYVLRFPECRWPGKFDIWFSSHQLFHVLVLVATLVNCHAIFITASNQFGISCD
jgi:adiponectin receptor